MYSELPCISELNIAQDIRDRKPFSPLRLCQDLYACRTRVYNLLRGLPKHQDYSGERASAEECARRPADATQVVLWCIFGVVKLQVGYLKWAWGQHIQAEAAWRAGHEVRLRFCTIVMTTSQTQRWPMDGKLGCTRAATFGSRLSLYCAVAARHCGRLAASIKGRFTGCALWASLCCD